MASTVHEPTPAKSAEPPKSLGLFDATTIVAGSMIGSGIFIVTGQMARDVGGAGWLLLALVISTLITLAAALSYGELAAMMPRAGGQYVYLREGFSPFWAFLYGWTLFFILQAGLIDAHQHRLCPLSRCPHPPHLRDHLPHRTHTPGLPLRPLPLLHPARRHRPRGASRLVNIRGIEYGKIVQNLFTVSKMTALAVVIASGLFVGARAGVIHANFSHAWVLPASSPVHGAPLWYVAVVAICLAQVGSLFAADAWNNVTFIAGDYVISAALFFYVLTVACVWRLRRSRPTPSTPTALPVTPSSHSSTS